MMIPASPGAARQNWCLRYGRGVERAAPGFDELAQRGFGTRRHDQWRHWGRHPRPFPSWRRGGEHDMSIRTAEAERVNPRITLRRSRCNRLAGADQAQVQTVEGDVRVG